MVGAMWLWFSITMLIITDQSMWSAYALLSSRIYVKSNSNKESVMMMSRNNNPFIGKILNKFDQKSDILLPTKQQGELVLKQLNLTASTEPKTFSVAPKNLPAVFFASLPAVFRFFTGGLAEGYRLDIVSRDESKYTILPLGESKQLAETSLVKNSVKDVSTMIPLVLKDQEFDASCRLVREACSVLSLTVQIIPSSAMNNNSQQQKQKLPTIQDPNTGVELQNNNKESVQIMLSYLFKTYGNGKVPINFNPNIATITARLAMASQLWGIFDRLSPSQTSKSSDPPPLPLSLWSYESSPFCKLVTEKLGQLKLPYVVKYTPRGSLNRQNMLDAYGRFQVPFLVDPNTGVELWESEAICEYLQKQYGVYTSVSYL